MEHSNVGFEILNSFNKLIVIKVIILIASSSIIKRILDEILYISLLFMDILKFYVFTF